MNLCKKTTKDKFKSYFSKPNPIIQSFQRSDEPWIDFVDTNEILYSILVCFAILLSIIYTGLNIRPQTIYQQFNKSYITRQRTSLRRQINFIITPLTNYNRYIRIYISFEKHDFILSPLFKEINIEYALTQYFENQRKKTKYNKLHLDCSINKDENISEKFILFTDYFINSRFLDVNIVVPDADNATFCKFIVDVYYGSNEYTTFKMYFSYLFIIIFIFYLLSFDFFISSHLNLQFLFLLLVSIILSNNPFYFLQVSNTQKFYYIFSSFSGPICDAFIYFSTLFFLEIYIIRIHSKSEKKFTEKVLVFSFLSFFYFIVSFFKDITILQYFKLENFPNTNNEKILNSIVKGVSVFRCFLGIIEFILVLVKICKIEHKSASLLVFLFLAALSFIQQSLIDGVLNFIYSHFYNDREQNKLHTAKFIIQNIFVLFITYVHWPYRKREKVEITENIP